MVLLAIFLCTLLFLLGGGWMAVAGFPWRGPLKPSLLWTLSALTPPAALYAWGYYWRTPASAPRTDWVFGAVGGLVLVSLVVALGLTWRLRTHRWFAAGVGMVMLGLSLFFGWVASLEIGPREYFG